MKAGMEILRPLLAETAPSRSARSIGTVKGDIHDIGKNLVAMMLEGAGFEVIDLGINTDVDKYLAALDEHQPDILGMSALLTTTMPYMKVVIDTLPSGAARRLHRARRRRAAQRGVRIGHRRRCLLPRRRGRGRDGEVAGAARRTCATPNRPAPRSDGSRPLVIACGALAAELRPCSSPPDATEVRYLPAQPPQPPRAHRPGPRDDLAAEDADRPCSSPTPTAAPGGELDGLLADHPEREPPARRPLLRVVRRRRAFAALHDEEPGTFLPHRLPGPALRCARVAGPRPRPPPGAAPTYFANYRRVVLLSQSDDPASSRAAARRPSASGSRSSTAMSAARDRRRRSTSRSVRVRGRPDAAEQRHDVVVILWRDIPAQVNGRDGGSATRCCCRPSSSGRSTGQAQGQDPHGQEDVAQWRRRRSRPVDGDLIAAAEAEAEQLRRRSSSPNERLTALVDNGGWDPTSTPWRMPRDRHRRSARRPARS